MFPEPPNEIELAFDREIARVLSPAHELRGKITDAIKRRQIGTHPTTFFVERVPQEELALIAGDLVKAGWKAEVFDTNEKNPLIRFLLSYPGLPKQYGIRISR